ncbi:MAG: DUF1343 domain-containing protein [Flavobacteriaceae bacterium]|nr:DUF1343 domain-containing protein [Flavobacteriaceae bacterium]
MKNLILSKSKYLILVFILILNNTYTHAQSDEAHQIITGSNQTERYLPLLKGKRVAIAANQTSVIFKDASQHKEGDLNYTHLVDSLISLQVHITKVFSPEHGFRGRADAGEHVSDDMDKKTGLPILSLHGKTRKATPEMLKDVDILIFDIQDVGVRFYTYISTMSNLMEAAAENNIPVIVLDRPNPNGHYVDGPMLEPAHKSFVGMHPVPLVYGLTIGEYATMVNGEKWLKDSVQCDLTIVPLKNYTHNSVYHLPIRPSPNLPNDRAINLYPGLGFFEGTVINAGRGTEFQFQRYGAPFFPKSDFSYTPVPNFGSKHPKFEGKLCYGVDLSNEARLSKVDITALIDAYQKTPKDLAFFGKSFTIHAGNLKLQKQIEAGLTADEIRATWQEDIEKFKTIRSKYLIYK